MKGRRGFLAGSSVLALGLMSRKSLLAAQKQNKTVRWAMIINLNRCLGCQSCVVACKNRHHTTRDQFLTKILIREKKHDSDPELLFVPVQCNQCENPPCVAVCPNKATFQLNNGVVVNDWSKCNGCGKCVEACPYDARFLDPSHGNKVDKCDFCMDRLAEKNIPSCVEACSSGARLFGNINAAKGEFAGMLRNSRRTVRDPRQTKKAAVTYIPHVKTGKIP